MRKTQRDQVLGQALGLPPTMALYSFIGVAVTSATVTIYGQAIWDPVEVLSQFRNPLVLSIGMVSLCLATLATNIAANVVGPANDFSHVCAAADFVSHRRTDHRRAGYLDSAMEVDRRSDRLHLPVAGGVFVAVGGGRRNLDRRLLRACGARGSI